MKASDATQPFGVRTYRQRRQALATKLAKSDPEFLACFWSGSELTRNSDCHFRFRAHSNFLYLSGFSEPESLILLLRHKGKLRTAIGLRPRDLSKNRGSEIWEGERVGVERAQKWLGFDEAFDIGEAFEFCANWMKLVPTVFWKFGEYCDVDSKLVQVANQVANARKSSAGVQAWKDYESVLGQMRKRKSAEEVKVMRRSAALAARGHIRAMQSISAGKYEYEVQAETEREFFKGGAAAPAYNSIVATGNNACTLHYTENNQKIHSNDLLLMDAGAELHGYASDITRCFPAAKKFSPAQAEIYELVLKAQKAAIKAVKPGAAWNKPHSAAVKVLSEGLSKLRIIKKTPAKIIKDGSWREFMPHGTSHWIGLDVHDAGAYFDEKDKPLKLEVGNVLTIEPGLYFRQDDQRVSKKYRGIGVRIEDDVLVTRNGHEVLTKDCPKEISEIEALRAPRL